MLSKISFSYAVYMLKVDRISKHKSCQIKEKRESLQTWKHSSGLSIFMHGVISLPDAMSYDKFKNFELTFSPPVTTFLVCICSLYFKQYGPRSDCSQGSSLIRDHSVHLHDEILAEMNQNKFSRCAKRTTFSG